MRKHKAKQASKINKGRKAIMVLCGLTAIALFAAVGGAGNKQTADISTGYINYSGYTNYALNGLSQFADANLTENWDTGSMGNTGVFAGFNSAVQAQSSTTNVAESPVLDLPNQGCGYNHLNIFQCNL